MEKTYIFKYKNVVIMSIDLFYFLFFIVNWKRQLILLIWCVDLKSLYGIGLYRSYSYILCRYTYFYIEDHVVWKSKLFHLFCFLQDKFFIIEVNYI